MSLAERICDFLFRRYDIGRDGDVYMTRYDIFRNRFGWGPKLYLHHFHRGDYDEALHDHPWSFWSLILSVGYWEVTPGPDGLQRKWYGSFSLLRRPAEWKHRVEVSPGTKPWTLVWCGQKVRSWSFWCGNVEIPWRQFEQNYADRKTGCPD